MLRTRQSLVAGAASAILVAMMSTGSAIVAQDEPFTIGVSIYGQDNFAAQGKEGIDAYAAARGIDVLWNDAQGDVTTQADQIDQYIRAGVDGILIAPVAFDSLAPQLQAAKDAGIKIGFVNATVKDDTNVDVAVLPDNVAAGRQGSQMMMDALGGTGNVALLQCLLGASYQILRDQGWQETLAKYPDINVVANDGAPNITIATDLVKSWLTAHPEIQGVIACGDEIGLGAYKAAEEAGLQILITGVDGTEDGLNAVRDGKFIGTLEQHARTEFAAGLAALYHLLKGEEMNDLYTYTMQEVRQENVDAFYQNVVAEKDAFLTQLPDIVDRNLQTGRIEDESPIVAPTGSVNP